MPVRQPPSTTSIGGECGVPDNTSQLVDFGTGTRQEIADAASNAGQGTRAPARRSY